MSQMGHQLPRCLEGRAAAIPPKPAATVARRRGSYGQNRTHAPQQTAPLFDDLVGAAE